MSAAPSDIDELGWLRVEVVRLRLLVERLTEANKDQARSIAELTGAEPGAAPSVACVYWFYAPTKWHKKPWLKVRQRLIHFVTEFGAMPAHEVTALVWDSHRTTRLNTLTHLGAPPSERTLNFSLIEVRAMLRWAVKRGMIRRHFLDDAELAKVKRRRETRIPPEELDQLLLAAEDLRDERLRPEDDDGQMSARLKAFILCCHDSMLRHWEAASLRRDRIRGAPTVDLLGQETKGARRRTVALTDRTLEAIARVHVVGDSPFVFARPATGKPYSPQAWRRWFYVTAQRAGLEHLVAPGDGRLCIRDLRPSGATAADEAGARPTAIRVAMGHASLKTTELYLRSDDVTSALSVAEALMLKAGRRGPKRVTRKKRNKLATKY